MSTTALRTLRETLDIELDEIAKKHTLSAGDLETAHKLTDTIKNIDKICILDESGEYSSRSDWEMEGRGTYDRGSSYARARDSRGRYRSTNQYSRTGSKERMIEKLDDMLNEANSEKEREAICRCIEQLEKA